jgi:hypothetical protein
MCDEVRRRHPGKLLVFITAPAWKQVVVMSGCADLVYGGKWWVYPFTFPANVKFFGLLAAVYNPQTTGEKSFTSGRNTHLINDLAGSCGFTITPRLTKLSPSSELIEHTRAAYGLDRRTIGDRLIIGINPGPNWKVKEWEAAKWQKLITKLHSEYAAEIIQFGTTKADGKSDYDGLAGVKSLVARLKGEELVALISICDLVISIDSGPVHVAGAVGTPVIGLFGPLNPDLVLTRESRGRGLVADVPCLFCHNRTPVIHWIDGCPNDIACMKMLEVDTVFDVAKSVLTAPNERTLGPPIPMISDREPVSH